MAWFNFFSHTNDGKSAWFRDRRLQAYLQVDAYPTFLQSSKVLSIADTSRVVIIAKVGATLGGTIVGHLSQSIGRRR
jgi:hypothetical protein